MSRVFGGLFGPDLPRWACELRPGGVVVVEATKDRKGVAAAATRPLPDGVVTPDVKGVNIADGAVVRSALEACLEEAGFGGSELIVVIPDDAVRISLVEAESLSGAESERVQFIRWKLKKHVPFDVSLARVAYATMSTNGSTRLVAVLSPSSVTAQYERVIQDLGLHPGIICPSTTAALNLVGDVAAAAGDAAVEKDRLFVKVAPGSIASAVVRGGKLAFYRKVPRSGPIEEAVHPTLMYYQDHLLEDRDRPGITSAILCVDLDDRTILESVRAAIESFGLGVQPLYSADLPDRVKPSLGAMQS